MDQRRQFLPAVVAVACFFVWMQVAPILFPDFFPKPKPKLPAGNAVVQAPVEEELAAPAPADGAAAPVADEKPAEFPHREIVLGEPGFEQGYLIKVDVSTTGGAVDAVWLTDPRFTTLDRKEQLRVVGNDVKRNVGSGDELETFDTRVALIDKLLAPHKVSLATVNWEVVKQDVESVTLRYPSPAKDFEILKTYRVPKVALDTRDTSASGYLLQMQIELKNLTDKPLKTTYSLTGPVGVPLENADNTRVFREIKLGLLENPRKPDSITSTSLLASALVKQFNKSQQEGGKPIEDWRTPIYYAGVDDQFFAALVLPRGNQVEDKDKDGHPDNVIAITRPVLLHLNQAKPDRSDMTVVMESPEITIPANKEVTNTFEAFFGPKRPAILRELNADSIIQLGWFAIVSRFMLWVLGFFHSIGLPYAFAIILLTVVVRLAMFPVSKKQAIEAEKMRILAPKMKEMQEKHKNQPEEFAKAYREFQRKHNYHPMVGCLPALIQLPIFLGLYNALYHAVDLRLARFLWIDNLAAPDNLFPLPFVVPYFGWTQFNLLPFITVALFVVQQKLFTPPPTSDEQAMQYKMMNFMMIAIGFAFYQVPAGLCLYFISSSLWGVCERLLLKKSLATHQAAVAEAGADDGPGGTVVPVPKPTGPKPEPARKLKAPGWWDRVVAAADGAKNTPDSQAGERKFSKDKGGKPRR
ncbi:YidC/Oxa1 family insertase periplasmic-domain containing protein [Planctomicrobium piriforme]|uniref:Membrane protein insertase YidC n=1 Tax=Planctomicrobium piriforme TaxID=1576369 RepID=A0A1I3RLV8_9PLAN|nr:YidC/Oxa1 family insertase periplasmic-domain containing protein [Planctomicrobium piriforme]SFJ46759.1 YidC/Oxa1 family membrane protein insertase [Planctomicrobium piriforme]